MKKICPKCKIEKSFADFDNDKSHSDGKSSYCKPCKKINVAKWQTSHPEQRAKHNETWKNKHPEHRHNYYIQNKDKAKERFNIWRIEHPKVPSERVKQWRIKHPGYTAKSAAIYRVEHPEYYRKYYAQHKEELLVYQSQYQKTDTGKLVMAATRHRRRAVGNISIEELKDIKEKSNGICPYCQHPIIEGHFDHIVPIAKGGKTEYTNMAWVCADCNRKKNAKDLPVFLNTLIPTEIPCNL
jgi:5-methylcytosine-specific restriction endonuclease McrA